MSKRLTKQQFIDKIEPFADLILPLGHGEPRLLLDWLEEEHKQLERVKIHQILPVQQRDYMYGKMKGHLTHVSYFLSGANRQAYLDGHIELVPNVFHEMPKILRQSTHLSAVLAVVSPIDEHGYFSLGTQAEYISPLIGKVPFYVEVNEHMPRTFGSNQIHISQVKGYVEHHEPLIEVPEPRIREADLQIADFIAERVRDGDTLQIGIGSIPNAVTHKLKHHRSLGLHSELISDGIVDLVKAGVIDGSAKMTNRGKLIGTFALGTERLHRFLHHNPVIELLPVDIVNHPMEIAKEDNIVSINATTEVDFYGQCASETIGGTYYSSTGGQADFARAVHFAKRGRGYICMHSTAKNGEVSRIMPHLTKGSVVTTSKNDVDHIVTEYGVAKLYGKSIQARTEALIQIAHPKFREKLTFEAKRLGFII